LLHLCPTCRRRFDEPGFCPFDRAPLVPGRAADQETLISGPILAQVPAPTAPPARPRRGSEDLPTVAGLPASRPPVDPATLADPRHDTFPLTPMPAAGPAVAAAPGPGRDEPAAPPAPVSTGEITAARTRPGPPLGRAVRIRPASQSPKLVVRSAADRPGEPRAPSPRARDHDYDKLIGQTLDGRYHVERKIGEGGMGVVFSARHAVIERPLAIKVLKREAMRDTATIRRFVQEAKAASRIGHPNIVDVTDFGTTPEGMTYSVMEFVPGQTLGTALKLAAPFAAPRAIRITAQIARALGAAHDKGIVHRDLKPENVFLIDRDGRPDFVKIVDFGIAKVTPPAGQAPEPRLTRAGSVFGTPEYMAPEQAAGRGDTDGRVDIYALGVLLYEMLCGRVPHRGDSMVRTLAMQMLDPIEPPSKVRPDLAIAPALEAVVMHALAKDRDQRYQTMAELLEALEAVLPPPVGQSVTGSPVYTLAALPPGADPNVVPALPAVPLLSSDPSAAVALPLAPAAASGDAAGPVLATQRRIKDEPEFTADDRPVSFQHVFEGERSGDRTSPGPAHPRRARRASGDPGAARDLGDPPVHTRRWAVLLFALIASGAAGAIALVIASRGADSERDRDTGATAAGSTRQPAGSAVALDAALARTPDDAELERDASVAVVLPERDAGRPLRTVRRGAGAGSNSAAETPNHRGTIQIQVLTKPEGANLYDTEGHYRGPGGAQIEEAFGTRRLITCKQSGYRSGSVEITFDGSTSAVLCVLQRIKLCVSNLKNPFDDCELAPGAAPPPPQN
jgi:serine/threonine-protein kinase